MIIVNFSGCSHQVDKVKSGQERGWKLDVLDHGQAGVVPALHRVGRRQDGRASVECADHSRLRNRHLFGIAVACINQMGCAHVVVQEFLSAEEWVVGTVGTATKKVRDRTLR